MYASDRPDLFRHFLEYLPVAAAMVDREMRYLAVSRQWVRNLGLEDADIIGRPCEIENVSEKSLLLINGELSTDENKGLASLSLDRRSIERLQLATSPWRDGAGEIGGTILSLLPASESLANNLEDSLRESEELFSATFEQAAVGIAHASVDGHFIRLNKKFCDIVGYTQAELSELTFQDITHPEDLAIDMEFVRQLLAGEILNYSMEKRYIRKDGSVVWINLTGSLVRSPSGSQEYFIGVIIDISDRIAAETKLRQSQAALLAAQELARVGNWEFDIATGTLRWSDEIFRIFGLEPRQTVPTYEEHRQQYHPDDLEALDCHVTAAIIEGKSFTMESRIIRPNGELRHIYSRGYPTKLEGQVVRLFGTVMDITERKTAEIALQKANEELEIRVAERTAELSQTIQQLQSEIAHRQQVESQLRASERRDRTLAEVLPVGIYRVDYLGNALYANDRWHEITGLTLEEANENGWSKTIHPDDIKRVFAEWEKLRRQNVPYKVEYRIVNASGKITWVLGECVAERNELGEIVGYVGTITDISDRKYLEKEVADRQLLFNNFIANAPIGIVIMDSQLRYVQINEILAQINGLSAAEHIGKTLREVVPELADELEATYQQILTNGEPIINLEINGETPQEPGKIKTWLTSYIPLRSEYGKPIAIGVIVLDITERKRSETELQRQAQLLDQLYDAAIATDFRGIITSWNKGAERIYGYAAAEAIGQPAIFLYSTDEQPHLQVEIMTSLQQQGTYEGEIKAIRKSGEIFDIFLSLSAQRDSEGAIVGTMGYGIDITERKRLEAERLATAQKLSFLIQQTPIALIEWNVNVEIMAWNPAAERIFGYSAQEVLGKSGFGLIIPESAREQVNEFRERVLAQQGELHGIDENLTKDGRTIFCEWYNTPLVDDKGRIIGMASLGLDISDRKKAEEALQQSEARFRNLAQREKLFNQLANQIRQSLNLDEILETTVNEIRNLFQIEICTFSWYRPDALAPAWEVVKEAKLPELPTQIGAYPTTVLGIFVEKLLEAKEIRVDDLAAVDDPVFQQFLQQLGIVSVMALPIFTRSGEVGALSCTCYNSRREWRDSEVELLRAASGQLAIAIDRARLYEEAATAAAIATAKSQELEQTLRELQQTQTHLIQSEKMSSLGQLVAGVAHEINNPVSFIYGNVTPAQDYASALLKLIQIYQNTYPQSSLEIENAIEEIDLDFIREDLPKLLFSMKVGAERIQEIVKSLRNFSRLDEASVKEVNLHEGIDSTLTILNSRLKGNSDRPAIEVIKEYSNLPLVECYAGQLNQVLMNLIANAIDALEEAYFSKKAPTTTTSASTIKITTERRERDFVAIRIADNGCGMSGEVQQKLFDPFFTTKPVGKGTGLGLAISYQIVVEKHKGKLSCISEVGKGTEFIIEIPIRQSH